MRNPLAYVAAILASITLSSAVSAGTTNTTKTEVKSFEPREARLLTPYRIINNETKQIILIGGEFDTNGDGIADREAYFSPCATGTEISAYYTFDFKKKIFVVDLSHLGRGTVTLEEKEADVMAIYDHAPPCRP